MSDAERLGREGGAGTAEACERQDDIGHVRAPVPDSDETTRAAISGVMTTRNEIPAATVRPAEAVVRRLS